MYIGPLTLHPESNMQVALNGIVQGLLFAIMGVAFSLVYSATRTFHVALGGIIALTPYVLLASLESGLGWVTGLIFATAIACLIGWLCEDLMHWPLLRKGAPPEVHLIASLGALLVIVQVVVLLWGADAQVLQTGIDGVFSFGEIRLTWAQVWAAITAIVLLAVFFFWLDRSALGLQFRAMADNAILLSLLGRDVRKLRRLVFAVSAGLSGIAAIATAHDVGFDPHGGLKVVLIGIAATIIGGRGSLGGAAAVGFALGIIRNEIVWLTSSQWEDAITFLLLALVLFARPEGLFGRKLRLEEKV